MTDEPGEVVGYQSAMDMPSFVKLKKQADGFKVLGMLLPKKDRGTIRDLTAETEQLAADVDGFYAKLGPRHWIFHDRLPTSIVREGILPTASVDDAESALCAIYEDDNRMKLMVMSMMRFPEMRAREKLIELAPASCTATSRTTTTASSRARRRTVCSLSLTGRLLWRKQRSR